MLDPALFVVTGPPAPAVGRPPSLMNLLFAVVGRNHLFPSVPHPGQIDSHVSLGWRLVVGSRRDQSRVAVAVELV